MFIFYTILYVLLSYLSFLLNVLGVSSYFSLIRESYFVYLFLMCFYKFIFINKFCIKISLQNFILALCVLLAVVYIFISNNFQIAVLTFILYFSGPILFLAISYLNFSNKTFKYFDFYFNLVLWGIFILNVLFYFIQNNVIEFIPEDILRHFSREKEKIRFLGIAFHPTITGFFLVFFIGYIFILKKRKISTIFSSVFLFFTGTRSAFLGIPCYIFFKMKKTKKIILLFLGLVFLFTFYNLLISGKLNNLLEPSAMAHFNHLLILGPKLILQYFLGTGIGSVSPYNNINPIIHLESDFYLYSIQLGVFNLILKIIFYSFFVKVLLFSKFKSSNYVLFVLMVFLVGCMVFPLYNGRFISNFVWILLGIEYSKIKNNKRCL